MVRALVPAMFGLLIVVCSPAQPYAQVASAEPKQAQIDIYFDGNEDVVRPYVAQNVTYHHHVKIILINHNQVIERHDWGGGGYDETKNFGQHGRSSWHVLPGNKLLGIEDYHQSTERIEISIPGNECIVTVSEHLKPGFTEYMFKTAPGAEWFYCSRREITSASCSIK